MKWLLAVLVGVTVVAYGHNSYTGGYSGAPGRPRCASSCHGGTAGTMVVSGFPSSYQPGQTYTIVVAHNGGSRIVNFNATTRVGSTTTVAGTFANVTNTALYSGADGGVYANPHAIDTAVFRWTAPAAGTGVVNFYCAGFQGTTNSANGQSTFITLSSTEITTGVETVAPAPEEFALEQNYPNPFNPVTTIRFRLEKPARVTLQVFDVLGREVATLIDGVLASGVGSVEFSAHRASDFGGGDLPSGVYFYRLTSGDRAQTRRMLLLR